MSLISSVKFHESLSLQIYKCSANRFTIGYGRNIEDRGITKEEAEMLLLNDLAICTREAEQFDFYHGLTGNRKDVIVEMVFNIGLTRFRKFKKTILYIKKGEYASASDEMLRSRWSTQVGQRAITLSNKFRAG